MTWVKIDDRLPTNAKVIGLSDKAFRVYVSSICYSSSNLTDGEIPAAALAVLGGNPKLAAELVEANLWETTSRKGWCVHDYLVYNRSRIHVDAVGKTRSEAGSKGAANRWQNAKQNAWQNDSNVFLSASVSKEPLGSPSGENTDTDKQTDSKLPSRHKPIDETFICELQDEHPTVNVRDVYERAQNRKTWDGYKDKRKALRDHIGYALNDRSNGNGRNGTRTATVDGVDPTQRDPELIRLRALGIIHE